MNAAQQAPDERLVWRAVEQLRAGEVVAIPTDTVYGLAAALDQPTAIRRIYELKGRDYAKPLPVLVSNIDEARRLAREFTPLMELVAERSWPGQLTMVVPASAAVPPCVMRGGDTVGLRMPNHPLALAIIEAAGGALAVTSANRSGELEARSAAEVGAVFGNELALIVDGGECPGGRPSTVVRIDRDGLEVLRVGDFDADILRRTLVDPLWR
jgi:L-threonylcarbamoyladenylate synthase